MSTTKLEPRDFQRVRSLGEIVPSGRVGEVGRMQIAKIPAYYYDFRRFEFPLTAAETTQEFGDNIQLFDESNTTDGSRQTNAETGSGVNEAFLAFAAGVIAMGEGEAFAIQGASLTRTDAEIATVELPALLTDGCYCGAVDLSNAIPTQANGTEQAMLWWGAPTWRFIEKFFQAYRLEVRINRRFQIVDESLFDVGMTPVPPEFVGASDSCIPTMPFIRAVNDVMNAKAIAQIFHHANILVADTPSTESLQLPPPCAGVTYGHPRISGLANRIYCFNTPILFIPGMRFDVTFTNVEDSSLYRAMTLSMQATCTGVDEDITTGEVNCVIPGGSVALGAVFKGYSLWPQACLEYLANWLTKGSQLAEMYGQSYTQLSGLFQGEDGIGQDLINSAIGNLGLPGAPKAS